MNASQIITLIGVLLGGGGFSALAGYVLGGRNERKKDERAAERETAALRARQDDEARVFQRDTLLELHDLLYKLNRNVGKSGHIDEMRYREAGRYGRDQLPDDVSEEFTELLTRVSRLRVRIFDPELRSRVEAYREAMLDAIFHGPRTEGDDLVIRQRRHKAEKAAMTLYGPLEEALGEAIRKQFPGSDVYTADDQIRLPWSGALISAGGGADNGGGAMAAEVRKE